MTGSRDARAGITSVGPARGENDPVLGELWMLNVAPQAWGTGLAVTLHDYALDRLREDGYESAILWVLRRNARGRRFYERSAWYADGGAKVDDFHEFPLDEVRYRIAVNRPESFGCGPTCSLVPRPVTF